MFEILLLSEHTVLAVNVIRHFPHCVVSESIGLNDVLLSEVIVKQEQNNGPSNSS